MTKAVNTAVFVSETYFHSLGKESPELRALAFLPRITGDAFGRWRSEDLEQTAIEILEDATLDVDDLVENHLGLTLSIEPLNAYDKRAGAPVFGMAFPAEGEIVICERAERYLPLYRTCVAHELGHIMLHGDRAHSRTLCYAPAAPSRPPAEREADEFMVNLLAPRSVFILATALAAHQTGLHLQEVFWSANSARGRWQWRYCVFPCLVDRLCLSRQFLSIRMRELGLFTNETVEFHQTYPLPSRWRSNVSWFNDDGTQRS